MLVSTLIVLGFNSIVGFSTNLNDEDVATATAAVAFIIGLLLKYFYR